MGVIVLGVCLASGSRNALSAPQSVQEKGGICVRQVGRSPAVPGVSIWIDEPARGAVLPAGQDVMLKIRLTGFEPGKQTDTPRAREIANSAMGQHVHVIVDNEPYLAFYDVSQPIALKNLKPGPHAVRVFPSRSYHESVKEPGAFQLRNFWVGEHTRPLISTRSPFITYSRPKGDYVGREAERLLVDFYLSNAQLGPDKYKARLTVDGNQFLLTEWTPYYVEGLSPGTHTFQMELLDPAGKVVPGMANSTTREINLKPATVPTASGLSQDRCCNTP
ncbi:MAG: hypothetical protein HY320_05765 [Armatimonadetes bacterium]|nr:hypothetical protein [Armatimonadota bacterium]